MPASHSPTVVVVGAGVGGLSAALRLAHRGYQVTLLERNDRVGGKLHLHTDAGFSFDTGPSLITLPQVFEDLYRDVGETLADHLSLLPLDPIQSYRWADGQTLSLRPAVGGDFASLLAEIERFAPGESRGFAGFLARGRRIWDLSAEMFLYHAPEQLLRRKDEPFDARKALSMITIPLRIGMFGRYSRAVDRCVSHPRLREVLYQYATYSGASPFLAPETLTVIPYAEIAFGGYYVQGGLYRLARSLEALLVARGGVVRTGADVAEVLIDPPAAPRGRGPAQVRGVRLATGEELRADAVVVNADVVYAYRHLIPARFRPRYPDATLDKLDAGGSGLVLLLGIEGTYPQLAHHTKFMPADYTSDLRAMFETHSVPTDPCIYVCASSRTDPTQAPPGCENLFVLVSAPNLQPRKTPPLDWARTAQAYRDQVVHTLEHRFGLTDLSKRIVTERRYSPVDLRRIYNANAGSIYGIGSNSRRTAFLRPPNRDKAVRGLYFAGGATHPGGGLPLVTLSGRIAAELLEEDVGGPGRAARPLL